MPSPDLKNVSTLGFFTVWGGVILIPVFVYSVGISWLFSKNKYSDYLFLGGR